MKRAAVLICVLALQAWGGEELKAVRGDFASPPVDCRPHTRWWWMGNALSKADITWQLEQMKQQGMGGVEQITMQKVFTKGNHDYLSPEYFDLLKHAVAESKRLGLEFSINFGGPGWIFGGDWVPPKDRNRNLIASFADLDGGREFAGDLPLQAALNPRDVARSLKRIPPGQELVAVLGGKLDHGRLVASSFVDLTRRVVGGKLRWRVPEGRWRLMAFWMVVHEDGKAVNHIDRGAMERYFTRLGDQYQREVGAEFGKTIESFFSDSFEVPNYRNGVYWSAGLLEAFRRQKGYDLALYLPALWWDLEGISPGVRFDVNDFLHKTGMKAFFEPFLGWCERHGVKGRMQAYGFVTDNIEGAGTAHIPEMEITGGEKDAVPWFDMRLGPRTYVASGAHLYGRQVVSVEAYTFQHWEQARETMEELKLSSDIFLRAGANKFYNSGFTGTPEREFVPSRRFEAEVMVNPQVSWWRYYRHLADYVSRCSAVLRHGRPVADIAVYSPLANQWTEDVFNVRRWTRDFDWGMLTRLLYPNGYDFELMNDDVLVRRSRIEDGRLKVRDLEFRVLLVPNVAALPLESMKRIEEFARLGGVVVALEQTPSAATGLESHEQRDAEVRSIAASMFREPPGIYKAGEKEYGRGKTYFLRRTMFRSDPLDLHSSPTDPFLNVLRKHVTPDVAIDLTAEGRRDNNGLLYTHRSLPGAEVYFLINLEDREFDSRLAFRVTGMEPEQWNPYDGSTRLLYEYDDNGRQTAVPVRLRPYESTLLVFAAGSGRPHVLQSPFERVLKVSDGRMEALACENGPGASGIPAPFEIAGNWKLTLDGKTTWVSRLASWTDDAATRHFTGTGSYRIEFDLPAEYKAPGMELELDLGAVGDVGEVKLNGEAAGVVWMRGQRLEVTRLARAGRNVLDVDVTNCLINRVSAWKKEPPLAPDLAKIYGSGVSDRNALYGFEPLPRSGLLGPVKIRAARRVNVAVR